MPFPPTDSWFPVSGAVQCDRERAKENGFDYHLTKPVEPTALLELLAAFEPTP